MLSATRLSELVESAWAKATEASWVTGRAAAATVIGLTLCGAAAAGFSAAAGFASSSAMMRRIDARISSIEGSWTFAGCVISDSTSKLILHQAREDSPVPIKQAEIFIAPARLVPRSSPPEALCKLRVAQCSVITGGVAPAITQRRLAANRLAARQNGMSGQLSIASKRACLWS